MLKSLKLRKKKIVMSDKNFIKKKNQLWRNIV